MVELSGHEGVPIKCWTDGVPLEDAAKQQLLNVAKLPIVGPHIAVMPDVHWGMGATVGSVIPTHGAIIPAAVGVDIGCGMCAVQTDLTVDQIDGYQKQLFDALENSIPVGGPGAKGSWNIQQGWWKIPPEVEVVWGDEFATEYASLLAAYPYIGGKNGQGYSYEQLGTLGTGNHFIEVCTDTHNSVWVMLHSGSRGVGNRIGTYFIQQAREEALRLDRQLPDKDLGWLDMGTPLFDGYVAALRWAQRFAKRNRDLMMDRVLATIARTLARPVITQSFVVSCHHNYVEERPDNVWVTRKGAVSARKGELGIIPGSMGARSFIVRGRGNTDSFESCSHGAGRAMSRGQAKRTFTLADHATATAGVECRKDIDVLDETPGAYKDIDAVMAAQRELVDIVATLKQVVCVKG